MVALRIACQGVVGAVLANVAPACIRGIKYLSFDSEIFGAETWAPGIVMEDRKVGLVRLEDEFSVIEREDEGFGIDLIESVFIPRDGGESAKAAARCRLVEDHSRSLAIAVAVKLLRPPAIKFACVEERQSSFGLEQTLDERNLLRGDGDVRLAEDTHLDLSHLVSQIVLDDFLGVRFDLY